jgi:stage IV sporulation protein FB
MQFIFKGIPIRFEIFFWITMGIISFGLWGNISQAFLAFWIMVFSIFFHELGHALMARFFGQKPSIEMTAFGGRTTNLSKPKLSLWKEFLVVLAGPLVGVCLAFISWKTLEITQTSNKGLRFFLELSFMINAYWTFFNMLPIVPLDGGQLVRIMFQSVFKKKGIMLSSGLSTIFAVLGVGYSLQKNEVILSILCGLFFIYSIKDFYEQKSLTQEDQNPLYQKMVEEALDLKEKGEVILAEERFKKILSNNSKGVLGLLSAFELAKIYIEKDEKELVFGCLLPFQIKLQGIQLYLLHQMAYELQKFSIVRDISQRCYQETLDSKVAFINSVAFAEIKDSIAALGWLDCSVKSGYIPSDEELLCKEFIYLKSNSNFQTVLQDLASK